MNDDGCVFLFPGQGAQFLGMGRGVAEAFPAARAVFERANAVVGFDLTRLCFEGPEAELTKTAVSQPAIYVTSFAVLAAMEEAGVLPRLKPRAAAGLSLGEFTALAYAGAMSFEDGLGLVQKRARFMQAAGEARPGTMAAVLGLDQEAAKAVCAEAASAGVVTVANVNTANQIVIAGEPAAVEAASRLALARGARGVLPLRVSAAFHSPLMGPARAPLAAALAETAFRAPALPVVANVTGRPHGGPDAIREALTRQVDHPVRWWDSMRWLLDQGFRTFYEVGPGRVLAGLLKAIDQSARCVAIGEAEAIRRLAESGSGTVGTDRSAGSAVDQRR